MVQMFLLFDSLSEGRYENNCCNSLSGTHLQCQNDCCSGCGNVSHQQQFLSSEQPLPRQSQCMICCATF